MGLKPKPRKIDQAEEAIIVAHAAAYAEKTLLPHRPATLKGIVDALLQRVESQSKAEAKMLRYYIQALAGNEFRKGDQAERGQLAGLLSVAYSPTPKSDHLPQILKLQWNILAEYIEGKDDFNGRVSWVTKHLPTILERIVPWRCLCDYKMEVQGAIRELTARAGQASRLRDAPLTPSVVILELLAALHDQAGTAHIRKLVNSRRPSLPTAQIYSRRRSVGVLDEHRFATKKAAELHAIARDEAIKLIAAKLPQK